MSLQNRNSEAPTGPLSSERPWPLGALAVTLTLIALALAIAREVSIQRELERMDEERKAEGNTLELGPLSITFERKEDAAARAEAEPDIRGWGDPWSIASLWLTAGTGMILGAVSWSTGGNRCLSGGAVVIGSAAMALHFVWIASVFLIAVVIVTYLRTHM